MVFNLGESVLKWTEVTIKNFSDYYKYMERWDVNIEYSSLRYFRGQVDENWSLQPSILRLFNKSDIPIKLANKIEKNAIEQFYSKAHLYTPNYDAGRHKTLIDRLSLMQHNSCPTRLLDWTMSPYVALYFAVIQEPNKNGTVWTFSPPVLRGGQKEKHGYIEIGKGIDITIKEDESIPTLLFSLQNQHHSERSAECIHHV